MEENMNVEVGVTTESNETEETNLDTEIEVTSGPSKGFVALCVTGLAAAVGGVIYAVNRHKKKKAETQVDDESNDQIEEDENDDSEYYEEESEPETKDPVSDTKESK